MNWPRKNPVKLLRKYSAHCELPQKLLKQIDNKISDNKKQESLK